MSDIIRLLPDSIANQIAAGEVVQRPASVVKELVENAIDAGAENIKVIIKDSGKTFIQVIDDGIGMSGTDARLSLERHATSKLETAEDLFKIKTMGFRGEAMASIAAVSQMELKTRQKDDELGTRIEVKASEVVSQDVVSCGKGTNITVKNLFYNIPARRNFLKSNSVEMRHIVDEFQRIALSYPDKGFILMQNDLETFNLSESKLSGRIVSIFGKNYQKQLTPVKEETETLSVHGYIGKPELSKKTRGDQYFFVNNRFIKSNYLNHAVIGAYEGLLQSDTFPFYVLFIDIAPELIDVNVHPTKTEIKFEDERTVYGIIKASIRQALGAHNLSPSIDFELDVNFGKERSFEKASDIDYSRFKMVNPAGTKTEGQIEDWRSFIEQSTKDDKDLAIPVRNEESESIALTFQSSVNTTSDEDSAEDPGAIPEKQNIVFQLQNKFVVTSVKSGMMVIDQHAAHQRILYERFEEISNSGNVASQRCLFPQTIHFSSSDLELMNDIMDEINSIGFDIELFGKDCVVVNGVPPDLEKVNEKELIEDIIEQYKHSSDTIHLGKREYLLRSVAKRSAIRSGKRLTQEEMISLIDRLFATKNPNYTPEGQRTFVILNINFLDNLFNS